MTSYRWMTGSIGQKASNIMTSFRNALFAVSLIFLSAMNLPIIAKAEPLLMAAGSQVVDGEIDPAQDPTRFNLYTPIIYSEMKKLMVRQVTDVAHNFFRFELCTIESESEVKEVHNRSCQPISGNWIPNTPEEVDFFNQRFTANLYEALQAQRDRYLPFGKTMVASFVASSVMAITNAIKAALSKDIQSTIPKIKTSGVFTLITLASAMGFEYFHYGMTSINSVEKTLYRENPNLDIELEKADKKLSVFIGDLLELFVETLRATEMERGRHIQLET